MRLHNVSECTSDSNRCICQGVSELAFVIYNYFFEWYGNTSEHHVRGEFAGMSQGYAHPQRAEQVVL